jgi:hypothetical protein
LLVGEPCFELFGELRPRLAAELTSCFLLAALFNAPDTLLELVVINPGQRETYIETTWYGILRDWKNSSELPINSSN